MPKINKRKYIDKAKEKLPDSWKPKFESLIDFLRYDFYLRWYKMKFLGSVNFIKYKLLKKPNPKDKKRILAITDFNAVSVALGAFIELQMRLLCEAYLSKADKIDFALVYNPERPATHWKYASWVTRDNFHLHLAETFPLLNLNPKLGSVLIFNSHGEFERFLEKNSQNYLLRPSFFDYVNKKSLFRGNYTFLRDFYLKHGFLPKLEIPNFTCLWTKAFIKRYVKKDRFLVAVNLRSNPLLDLKRNASLDAWRELFIYCLERYPNVTFLILGRKSEVAEGLKSPNVIFLQDFNVNIQHTLSFIKHSLFYMAVSSGPASFALLSESIPYAIMSFRVPDIVHNYSWFKPGTVLPWQNKEFQKLVWERETPEILIKEFEDLLGKVNKEKWRNELDLDSIDESILDWPHLVKK